jgi:mRNA interferase MazF
MSKKITWIPSRGEIIWIDFNPQSGREMRDRHPMLVLSPIKFNERTGIVIGLPMTTAKYNSTNPFAISFKDKQGKVSYVLTHQPKSFDWRERNAKIHPWKQVPAEILSETCELLNQIITLTD